MYCIYIFVSVLCLENIQAIVNSQCWQAPNSEAEKIKEQASLFMAYIYIYIYIYPCMYIILWRVIVVTKKPDAKASLCIVFLHLSHSLPIVLYVLFPSDLTVAPRHWMVMVEEAVLSRLSQSSRRWVV